MGEFITTMCVLAVLYAALVKVFHPTDKETERLINMEKDKKKEQKPQPRRPDPFKKRTFPFGAKPKDVTNG